MPGAASTVGDYAALDAKSGRATQTARTTYLVLLTAAPNKATTMANMAELTTPGSNGYNRQSVTWAAPSGTAPAQTSNTAEIVFGPLTADLANVTHLALVSASTGTAGDLIHYWTADTARDPATNDTLRVAAGALVMTEQ